MTVGTRPACVAWRAWTLLGLGLVGSALPAAQRSAPGAAATQHSTPVTELILDGVTVIDVEQGTLIPAQRVVIAGNHIRAVGSARAVPLPKDAHMVDARGKYLIPGLWDIHTHPGQNADLLYPLFLANGVTGIRNASSAVPLDSLLQLQREILAGRRIGPPRQLLVGAALDGPVAEDCEREKTPHICIGDTTDARHVVDSLQAAGASMLKMYNLTSDLYFFIAALARTRGLPFGGHAANVSAGDAADSGASIIDHINSSGGLDAACWGRHGALQTCQPLVERLRRHNTWFDPTLTMFAGGSYAPRSGPLIERLGKLTEHFWAGMLPRGNWFRDTTLVPEVSPVPTYTVIDDSVGAMELAQRAGLPVMAGTDVTPSLTMSSQLGGFSLHTEIAMFVAEGLTPLAALQSATINPAKMLRATDSLGTVASGKLADLVLLDDNPLDDITNIKTIRAVVANGRYFDRAALDRVLADLLERVKLDPPVYYGP